MIPGSPSQGFISTRQPHDAASQQGQMLSGRLQAECDCSVPGMEHRLTLAVTMSSHGTEFVTGDAILLTLAIALLRREIAHVAA